jgi:3-deoxy-manno-octulosonate cytidylyltransferase (CMP-KDO synthetase)
MKAIGVIPARYDSSRFPGKPLADIHGKPMIWWVYQEAIKTEGLSEVYIATDDKRIKTVCDIHGMNAIMTSDKHPTGTDRVAEVANTIPADLYLVIMGDEPLINANILYRLIEKALTETQASAVMLTQRFTHLPDIVNSTTIKIALSNESRVIFMSRSPIPYPKASINFDYYKNIGAYVFTKEVLRFFQKTLPGKLEDIEEIELLRLLENGKIVYAQIVDIDSISVDTPKDLDRVRQRLIERVGE